MPAARGPDDDRVADLWAALDALARALTVASRTADRAQIIADDLKYREAGSAVIDVRTGLCECYSRLATLYAASGWHLACPPESDGGI